MCHPWLVETSLRSLVSWGGDVFGSVSVLTLPLNPDIYCYFCLHFFLSTLYRSAVDVSDMYRVWILPEFRSYESTIWAWIPIKVLKCVKNNFKYLKPDER